MSQIVVSISDMKFSKRPADVIVTYSLGSCLGVAAYDPVAGVGAILHALLPVASASPERAKENPYMFVNSGMASMVKILFQLGAKKRHLVFKVAGGSNMRGDTLFNTGLRNMESFQHLMDTNRIPVSGCDVGGTIPRTLFLHMDTGRVSVRSLGKEKEL